MYGVVVLLFLAGLSFAAEESPTCGDGDEITLTIEEYELDLDAVDTYDWTFGKNFFDWGGRVLDTTGPTTTIRCPHCVDSESRKWDFHVELWDEDTQSLQWAYGYFNHDCPEMGRPLHGASCASNPGGGSVWFALLALAFRRRRS